MSMEWPGFHGCRSGAALGAAEPRLAIHRGAQHTICQVIQICRAGRSSSGSVAPEPAAEAAAKPIGRYFATIAFSKAPTGRPATSAYRARQVKVDVTA
jgi:hypothetical protein